MEEVGRLLKAATPLHHQISFTTVYSLGLRPHEALSLQVSDIDGQRLHVHIHRGKGATDRYVPLPEDTLALLRTSWKTHRHQTWLFPATGRDQKPSPTATSPMSRARGQGACRNRHCPQRQYPTTQQWLHNQLEKQLPGPHFLLTFTVPETLRPFLRSHQQVAYPALFKASATALQRLAQEKRFIGTNLPGFTGVLHPWGRQLQDHPHIHDIVPGGGLSKDRDEWLPSRANFFVPVKALSPIYRTLFKEDMRQAGRLAHLDPQVWHLPWNVHSQANQNGHSALTSLAPYVFRGAISNQRLVGLKDRTVTFASRKPGRLRPRTTSLDVIECLRRFLPHVLPDGFMQGRHFGFRHASCAVPTHTLRQMIVQACPTHCKPTRSIPPQALGAWCPTCGVQMRLVMRRWTSGRVFVDTS